MIRKILLPLFMVLLTGCFWMTGQGRNVLQIGDGHTHVAIIALHGWGDDPTTMVVKAGLLQLSKDTGATVFVPDGQNNVHAFNAGTDGHAICCTPAAQNSANDVGWLANFIVMLHQHRYSRVYLMGFSNGAMLALDFACQHPDLAPVIGMMAGTLETATCPGVGRFRALSITGANDGTVPWSGPGTGFLGNFANSVQVMKQRVPVGVSYELIPGVGHAWAPNATADMARFFGLVRQP